MCLPKVDSTPAIAATSFQSIPSRSASATKCPATPTIGELWVLRKSRSSATRSSVFGAWAASVAAASASGSEAMTAVGLSTEATRAMINVKKSFFIFLLHVPHPFGWKGGGGGRGGGGGG